jgi:hypothetical protein
MSTDAGLTSRGWFGTEQAVHRRVGGSDRGAKRVPADVPAHARRRVAGPVGYLPQAGGREQRDLTVTEIAGLPRSDAGLGRERDEPAMQRLPVDGCGRPCCEHEPVVPAVRADQESLSSQPAAVIQQSHPEPLGHLHGPHISPGLRVVDPTPSGLVHACVADMRQNSDQASTKCRGARSDLGCEAGRRSATHQLRCRLSHQSSEVPGAGQWQFHRDRAESSSLGKRLAEDGKHPMPRRPAEWLRDHCLAEQPASG